MRNTPKSAKRPEQLLSAASENHQLVDPANLSCGCEDFANFAIEDANSLLGTAGAQRRDFFELLAGGGLATLLTANQLTGNGSALVNSVLGASNAMAQQDQELSIGYLPITDATPLLVAWAKGYFADAGITAPRPQLIRSWPSLVEGFITRRFNVVHLLKPIPVWMRYNNGIKVKVVAWMHTNGSAIVVSKRSGINSFQQCAGKQFAVPFWYSIHNVLLQTILKQNGLTPVIQPQQSKLAPGQVNLLVMPPPEMPAALAAGKIDGYVVAEPFNALGELKAQAKILRFTGDVWKDHPCCVMTMHEDDLQQRSAWSQRVVDAVTRAAHFAANNRSETAKLLSSDGEGFLPVDAKVVERAMNYYRTPEYSASGAQRNADNWNNNRIDFNPWPYPSATRDLVTAMQGTIVGGDKSFLRDLDPAFVSDDLVDSSFIGKSLQQYPWQVGTSSLPARERQENYDY